MVKTYKDVVGDLAAYVFAKTAHAAVGQKRKYTNEPYIVHPMEVVRLVSSVPHNSYMIQAAYLHDVLEDTKVTYDHLAEEFDVETAQLVYWLTDKSIDQHAHLNRAARKEIDRNWISLAPAEAKTIKLADLISNTRSIVEYDPKFAAIYLQEKKLLLEVLTDGDPTLYLKCQSLLTEGFARLEQLKEAA